MIASIVMLTYLYLCCFSFQNDFEKGVWVTLNGGLLQMTKGKPDFEADQYPFVESKLRSGGYGKQVDGPGVLGVGPFSTSLCYTLCVCVPGLIDVAWKDDKEVWVVGGGGVMYVSKDGGETFSFNAAADDIPGNLYRVKFFGDRGFVLGSEGVLLSYNNQA